VSKALIVIPARLASTRFPEKIIASRTGRPLVQHVVDQVRKCRLASDVIVAADDAKIVDALRPFNTPCVLTRVDHPSGTDRIAEVARSRPGDSLIVNVQGDEPEIEPEVVDRLIQRMLDNPQEAMGTAATEFPAGADSNNPNLVKVVLARDGKALYFSRSPIPFRREPIDANPPPYLLHLGLYAYRRDFLLQYAAWEPTPLERTEKLEQLRALERGASIGVVVVRRATHGVDTPEQYEAFVRRFQANATAAH
jgi:3-deoxy-manno-octulosonate cytidylyltransferase (CMP-KDO synthetase)